jgi:hypothetical protein
MLSRVLPLDDLAQRSVMYWLPPGGQDNGVWATMWVVIAELETREVAPVLARMADADIGAYATKPAADGGRRLYVDVMQYNQAADVLMVFLRKETAGKSRAASVPRASTHGDARGQHAAQRRSPRAAKGHSAVRVAVKVAGWVFFAALLIGALAVAYFIVPMRLSTAHPLPPPPAGVPLTP